MINENALTMDTKKSREEIVERIKKLLRKTNGGTPEEIASALAKAQEIAAKYSIDLGAVDPSEEGAGNLGHHDTPPKARLQWEETYAQMICDEFFNVTAFTLRGYRTCRVVFVGTPLDRKIAEYVFEFLVGHCRRSWAKPPPKVRNRRAFMYGIFLGVSSRLRGRQPKLSPENPLAIAQTNRRSDHDRYIETEVGGGPMKSVSVRPDTKAEAAMNSGWAVGRSTEIRPAVETTRPVARLGSGQGEFQEAAR